MNPKFNPRKIRGVRLVYRKIVNSNSGLTFAAEDNNACINGTSQIALGPDVSFYALVISLVTAVANVSK